MVSGTRCPYVSVCECMWAAQKARGKHLMRDAAVVCVSLSVCGIRSKMHSCHEGQMDDDDGNNNKHYTLKYT